LVPAHLFLEFPPRMLWAPHLPFPNFLPPNESQNIFYLVLGPLFFPLREIPPFLNTLLQPSPKTSREFLAIFSPLQKSLGVFLILPQFSSGKRSLLPPQPLYPDEGDFPEAMRKIFIGPQVPRTCSLLCPKRGLASFLTHDFPLIVPSFFWLFFPHKLVSKVFFFSQSSPSLFEPQAN